MAEITKSVAAAHGMRAHLVPVDIRARLTQAELEARLAYSADLSARAASCGNQVLASCYTQVAKAALAALPGDEVARQARGLRAKAGLLGSGDPADRLRRQADDLEAANPQPPRASVRKAAAGTTLTPLYDCNGLLFGVAEADDIVPALDPDVIVKASASGMVATHHPQTGKVTGFVHPDKVTPVVSPGAQARKTGPVKAGGTTGTGLPKQAAAPAAPRPGDLPDRQVTKAATPDQVIKSMGLQWMPVFDWQGRLGGAVPRSQVTPLTEGQVLKGAAASSRANVYDARRRRVGTAALAAIVQLADLPGRRIR